MRHSLRTHLLFLENSLQDVKNRLTQTNLTPEQAEDLQLQVALGESALEHYRQAYELEMNFAGSGPPPGGEPALDGTGGEGKPGGDKKKGKEGLVTTKARPQRRRLMHHPPVTFRSGMLNARHRL